MPTPQSTAKGDKDKVESLLILVVGLQLVGDLLLLNLVLLLDLVVEIVQLLLPIPCLPMAALLEDLTQPLIARPSLLLPSPLITQRSHHPIQFLASLTDNSTVE
jgi:hypothetical protein